MSATISIGSVKTMIVEGSAQRCIHIRLSRGAGAIASADQVIYNNTTVGAALDDLYSNPGNGGNQSIIQHLIWG
jgi:hypothetical protein